MTLKLTDLYLAFRQAKAALFFERRGFGLLALARFERRLGDELRHLQQILQSNGGWFDGIEPGEILVVPKRLQPRSAKDKEELLRVGVADGDAQPPNAEIQLRVAPTPAFAILEVLYLWRFGPALDSLLTDHAVGYRLDLRDKRLDPTRRWLFEYWPERYQQYRTAPLKVAKALLKKREGGVIILSTDLATYYDTIDPSFLLRETFVEQLRGSTGGLPPAEIDAYLLATRSLLNSYSWYCKRAERLTGAPWLTGLPIGPLTSRLIANVALASLDADIVSRPDVHSYHRYVDDMVIVGDAPGTEGMGFEELLRHYLPIQYSTAEAETILIDSASLNRDGSDFRLRRSKTRIHHLNGIQGEDFINSVAADFRQLVSERRSFIDSSIISEGAAARVVHARRGDGGVLRSLRDADRTKLERFAVATLMSSLERASGMLDIEEARRITRRTLDDLVRYLDGEKDWVENLDLEFRLLSLSVATGDVEGYGEIMERMEERWGSLFALRNSLGHLTHRERIVTGRAPWLAMRNYLHARRVEAIAAALPLTNRGSAPNEWLMNGIPERTRVLSRRSLIRSAKLLADADLRVRDREEGEGIRVRKTDLSFVYKERELKERLEKIRIFTDLCSRRGDLAWAMEPARLFLATRPPSYFDIAVRWLHQLDTEGGGIAEGIFTDLLDLVNAVRGTRYHDPVGCVVDAHTVEIPARPAIDRLVGYADSRLILGNLTVPEGAFKGGAVGKPVLSAQRLKSLVDLLARASTAARRGALYSSKPCLLVLPELSVPRRWFRALARHVVQQGEFGLVTGLEYLCDNDRLTVVNQVYAVLPGPYFSVATWPWTKRLPAREESVELGRMRPPRSFPSPSGSFQSRVVVNSSYGRFSVLICSEIIEARRVADLLGRVELVLTPSWNKDTASYDHLIQTAALQLHAVIAVANIGHYSDSRAWAPRSERWERELGRLIQRAVDEVVTIEVPLASLRSFQRSDGASESARWKPLPPEWR